jgi:hypothetical protein
MPRKAISKSEPAPSREAMISLAEVANRFAKAKGMDAAGYQWLRVAPGRGADKEKQSGNSLAVQKALRAFNLANGGSPIQVYKAKGYDGTPRTTVVMSRGDIIRLKGFVLRAATSTGRRGRARRAEVPFTILEKMEL